MSRQPARAQRRAPRIKVREFTDIAPPTGVIFKGWMGLALLGLALAVAVIALLVYLSGGGSEYGVHLGLLVLALGYAAVALVPRMLPASTVGIVVGADGVLFQDRFIPYATIRSVEHECTQFPGWSYGDTSEGPSDSWSVSLRLVGGEVVKLTRVVPDELEPEIAELARAIKAAHEAWMAGQRARDVEESAVQRGGRSGPEWLEELRGLGSGKGAYRSGPMDAERLSRLIDDDQARPSARAAAAVVLTASGDTKAAQRLRIATYGVANPRVRVALEKIADASDDAAVAEALEALDEADRHEHR